MNKITKDSIEYIEHIMDALHLEMNKAKSTGTYSPIYMREKLERIEATIENN